MAEVPGTHILSENQCKWDESRGVDASAFSSRLPHFHLQPRSALATPRTPRPIYKKRTRDGRIIFVPQPEDTPNDPLNWSRWRRELSILCLASFSLFFGMMTCVLAGGLGETRNLLRLFDLSALDLGFTTATFMIGLAVGHIFQAPTAVIFGKRVVYLYSAWLFIITSMWCAFSISFPVLLCGRFFMGFALSPVEVLIPATLAELFPLHQRGKVLGLYLAFFLGSFSLAPVVGALIVSHLSWRWAFVMAAIPGTWSFFMILFLVPESFWDRETHYMHTKECIDTWSRSYAGKSIIETCRCIAMHPGDVRIGKPVIYDGASPKRTNPHTLARREQVLAKLHLRSAPRSEKHLKVSDAVRNPPVKVTATTTTTATAVTTATAMASYNTVDLSPAEAEYTLAQEDFEHPRPAPLTPRRRHAIRVSQALDPSSAQHGAHQRPSYLRFVPSAIWPSRSHETQPRSARTPKFNTMEYDGSASRSHMTPVVSPNTVTHHLSHLSDDGPHGRSSLSQEIRMEYEETPLPPPSHDFQTVQTSSSETTTSIINRRLSRPALRLNLDSVLFDREGTNDSPIFGSVSQWRSQQQVISPDPPTSLPTTPSPTEELPPTYPTRSKSPLAPAHRIALYTDRRRLPGRKSWTNSLRLWNGRLVATKWTQAFVRPFRLSTSPILLWAALVYTLSVGLLTTLPRVVFLLFAGPWAAKYWTGVEWSGGKDFWNHDYNLDVVATGALSLGTLAGSVLGAVLAGVVADSVAVRLARRNDGVFEPEFRLLGTVPGMVLVIAGALGLGYAVEAKAAWQVSALCLVLLGAGCAIGAVAAVLYVLDILTAHVAEAMVVLGVVKCLCHGLVFALVIDRWIDYRGPKEVFIIIAGMHGFAMLATIPVYVFGKRSRAWGARRNLTR
ncbi:hypothetical protein K461DRAFT_280444 [Myriangium duriaei CBS 260.36]|uniref:Major facilitator superfamily (MFS) profile domain-containing protein n=1 Tax=Myriangium duriaei CBS 260.36 TaxID=1168546 RepID=A0A9P4MDW0_9PEZI|nr:hypothetical protein K461DRAFT_280444 [Myriangium duriaei CBS 260.36]